jgi:hypothetical protein
MLAPLAAGCAHRERGAWGAFTSRRSSETLHGAGSNDISTRK